MGTIKSKELTKKKRARVLFQLCFEIHLLRVPALLQSLTPSEVELDFWDWT
ncbi:hypothetical protein [Mycoplasma wenyonii]|uniref:hypothetical protein n=1 Tax=Mycoplasma wenyonii TaxID=65123 RepID=UPI0015EBE305|nr:hypothetical protein [Mycoplasma wenyonii]